MNHRRRGTAGAVFVCVCVLGGRRGRREDTGRKIADHAIAAGVTGLRGGEAQQCTRPRSARSRLTRTQPRLPHGHHCCAAHHVHAPRATAKRQAPTAAAAWHAKTPRGCCSNAICATMRTAAATACSTRAAWRRAVRVVAAWREEEQSRDWCAHRPRALAEKANRNQFDRAERRRFGGERRGRARGREGVRA